MLRNRLAHRDLAAESELPAEYAGASSTEWTIVIPFFNERAWLPDTIASLAAQVTGFRLVLVDNGSTDGSGAIAREACRSFGIKPIIVVEKRRGKVAALEAGIAHVRTRFVATCDADTWYPPTYLEAATKLLEHPGCVAAGAFYAARDAGIRTRLIKGLHVLIASHILAGQCHAGGAGQVFRTQALREAGCFDPGRWNLVLEDHEMIHQILKQGRVKYSLAFWSAPSPRKRDRDPVCWSIFERLLYHAVVGRTGDWFFRDFLAPRLRARQLTSERLRERTHVPAEVNDAASNALC